MPKRKRFKLLLDEMLPRRIKLPRTNHYHDLKHMVHDLHKAGMTDLALVTMAKQEDRIIVTNNVKHFKKICQQAKVSLIGVNQTMLPDQMDKKLLSLLSKWPVHRICIKKLG
jgi:hypothetical protein